MTLTLWIPPSAREKSGPVRRCTVPGCGRTFPMEQHQNWRRHVKACAKKNFGGIEAALARREETYFTKSADPERYAHIRKNGGS